MGGRKKVDTKIERIETPDERENREILESWLVQIKTDSTRKAYMQGMRDYMAQTGMTPKQLLDEAIDEDDRSVPQRRRKINGKIKSFLRWYENGCPVDDEKKGTRKLAENTIHGRIVGVKSFYTCNGLEVPTTNIDKTSISKRENRAIPTKDDLRDVLKVADQLEKALALVGVSSGLSCNEIINLKISDFKKGYDPKSETTALELKRIKTGVEFTTFVSPEATRAVIDYLEARNVPAKEKATQYRKNQREKQHITSEDGYVFITRNVPEEYLETRDEELRKLTQNAVSKIYSLLGEKVQKTTPKGAFGLIRSHNMRKYFNSALINAGVVDPFYVDYFMGHRPLKNMPQYLAVDKEKFRDIYKKCVPHITIAKELDVTETKEWQDLEKQVEYLEHQNADYAMRAEEVEAMSRTNEEMAALMRKTLDRARKQIKIFEDGSKALGLPNYFDEFEIDFTNRKKKDETEE